MKLKGWLITLGIVTTILLGLFSFVAWAGMQRGGVHAGLRSSHTLRSAEKSVGVYLSDHGLMPLPDYVTDGTTHDSDTEQTWSLIPLGLDANERDVEDWNSPLKKNENKRVLYYPVDNRAIFISAGPDKKFEEYSGDWFPQEFSLEHPEVISRIYDRSNGIFSEGDMFRVTEYVVE